MSGRVDLDALEKRYTGKPVPTCHICGIKMTPQRMHGSHITYGCTGRYVNIFKYKPGRSLVDDHYGRSRIEMVDLADRDVLAAVQELRLLREKLQTKGRKAKTR